MCGGGADGGNDGMTGAKSLSDPNVGSGAHPSAVSKGKSTAVGHPGEATGAKVGEAADTSVVGRMFAAATKPPSSLPEAAVRLGAFVAPGVGLIGSTLNALGATPSVPNGVTTVGTGGDRGGDVRRQRNIPAVSGGSGGSITPASPIRTVLSSRRFTGTSGTDIRSPKLGG